jgi:hypothetical protein
MVAPLLLWAGFVGAYVLSAIFEGKSTKFTVLSTLRRIEVFGILTITSLYTIVVSSLFSTVKCHSQPDGSYTLVDNNSIHCFQGEWKEKHFGSIMFFSVVYLILIPFWLLAIFYRMKLDSLHNFSARPFLMWSAQHLEFLRKSFKRRYYWWSAVDLFKRVAIIATSFLAASADDSKNVTYLATLIMLIIFLLVDISVMQYARLISLRVSLLWNSVALIVLLTDALMFKASTISETAKNVFSGVLIGCVCCSVLVATLSRLPFFANKGQSALDLSDCNTTACWSADGKGFHVSLDADSLTRMKSRSAIEGRSEVPVSLLLQFNNNGPKTEDLILTTDAIEIQPVPPKPF